MSCLVWWRGTGKQRKERGRHGSRGKTRSCGEGEWDSIRRRKVIDSWTKKIRAASWFISLLLSSVPFIQRFLSLFSLGYVWILFCQCCLCLYLCPPLFPVSHVLFQLPAFSLSLSLLFLPGFGALSAKWKRVSVQAVFFFFKTRCFRQTSGVPEHVLTTPTHRTSHSTFMQRKHRHTFTHAHMTAVLHLLKLHFKIRFSLPFNFQFPVFCPLLLLFNLAVTHRFLSKRKRYLNSWWHWH